MSKRYAQVMVFATSAAVLVLEILAGRLMAPYVGVSLETFTGIIGTILAGIALGAAVARFIHLIQIAAAAEQLATRRQDRGADGRVGGAADRCVEQLVRHFRVQRVGAVGPV